MLDPSDGRDRCGHRHLNRIAAREPDPVRAGQTVRRALRVERRRSRSSSGRPCGSSGRHPRRQRDRVARWTSTGCRRAVLSGRDAELRGERPRPGEHDAPAIIFKSEGGTPRTMLLARAARRVRGVRRGACARRASAPAIAWRRICPTCPRRSSRCSARRRSARSGRPARPTSASGRPRSLRARSSRASSSPPTATSTAARRSTSARKIADRPEAAADRRATPSSAPRGWEAFIGRTAARRRRTRRLPFNHPLYILYSSGTTGVPEVHRARRRRHAASAPQGAPAPLRHPAGRPRVLLHDAAAG